MSRRLVCPKTAMVGGKRRKVHATATTCSVVLKNGKRKRIPAAKRATTTAKPRGAAKSAAGFTPSFMWIDMDCDNKRRVIEASALGRFMELHGMPCTVGHVGPRETAALLKERGR